MIDPATGSLPSRERGLKFLWLKGYAPEIEVAPFAGAWIEIQARLRTACTACVAPFAGAWIEISSFIPFVMASTVAPFAGAWIEIAL